MYPDTAGAGSVGKPRLNSKNSWTCTGCGSSGAGSAGSGFSGAGSSGAVSVGVGSSGSGSLGAGSSGAGSASAGSGTAGAGSRRRTWGGRAGRRRDRGSGDVLRNSRALANAGTGKIGWNERLTEFVANGVAKLGDCAKHHCHGRKCLSHCPRAPVGANAAGGGPEGFSLGLCQVVVDGLRADPVEIPRDVVEIPHGVV